MLGFSLAAFSIDVIYNVRTNFYFLIGEYYKHSLELTKKVSVDETKHRVCSKRKTEKITM